MNILTKTTMATILALSFCLGCAEGPLVTAPPIGKTILILPSAINAPAPVQDFSNLALLLNVVWDNTPLTTLDNPTLRFYEDTSKPPVFSFSWADLEQAWQDPSCTPKMVEAMSGVEGQALVCDGSIDISKIIFIDAINDQNEIKSATSWGQQKISDDAVLVTVTLY